MWQSLIVTASLSLLLCFCSLAGADNRALLIGIDAYQTPGVPALRGAVRDAQQMQRLAERSWGYQPQQIRLLLDKQATRDNILQSIRTWLIQQTVAGDHVLFFYSGHGHYTPDTSGDEADGQDETLVPVDVYRDASGALHNMIIDDALQELLDHMPDRQVMVIVDACHSGTVTRSGNMQACQQAPGQKRLTVDCHTTDDTARSRSLPVHRREASLVSSTANRVVWSAAAAAQIAFEDVTAPPPSGVFTSRFVAGIAKKWADANKNGQVTYAELLDYLQRESEQFCRRTPSCTLGLTPTLEAPPALLAQPADAPLALTASPNRPITELATEVLSHAEEGQRPRVQLEILPGSPVRRGTTVRFRITSALTGHLVVLDTNAKGELTQIFPNSFSQANNPHYRIRAHRPLTIPEPSQTFDFQATDPGPGTLIAVVTADPIDLQSLVGPHKDLQIIANPSDYLLTLGTRLRQTWVQDTVNRRVHWAVGKLTYEILP